MGLLSWALVLLVVAIGAAALGLGGVASLTAEIAEVFFFAWLVMFILLFVMDLWGVVREAV